MTTPYWKIITDVDGRPVKKSDSPLKIYGRYGDWDYPVNDRDDVDATLQDKIRELRNEWCWRVRGWGPNTSNQTDFCKIYDVGGGYTDKSLLGDADQDYYGRVGCGTAPPYEHDIYPGHTEDALDEVLQIAAEPGLQYYHCRWLSGDWDARGATIAATVELYIGDDFGLWNGITGHTEGALLVFGLPGSISGEIIAGSPIIAYRHFPFPITLAQILNPQCNIAAMDDVEDEVGDPDNPDHFVPWCRGNGGTLKVDLW